MVDNLLVCLNDGSGTRFASGNKFQHQQQWNFNGRC